MADPARGMFTGNRGILNFTDGRLGTSRWSHPHWIICALTHPRGKYHGVMPQNAWTPLFFLDEVVGLAAGHRPCAYCRRPAYQAFKSAWNRARACHASHAEIDKMLHKARVTRMRQQVRFQAEAEALPEGTFVLLEERAHVLRGGHLLPYSPGGYGKSKPLPSRKLTVLTPEPTVAALQAGFLPIWHPSAD